MKEFNKTQLKQDLTQIVEDEREVKIEKSKKREFHRAEKETGKLIILPKKLEESIEELNVYLETLDKEKERVYIYCADQAGYVTIWDLTRIIEKCGIRECNGGKKKIITNKRK